MKIILHKIVIIILLILVLLAIVYLLFFVLTERTSQSIENNFLATSIATKSDQEKATTTVTAKTEIIFLSPLSNPPVRITKKIFGMYITPKTSPVQPERFQGYHTGIDFEIFPDELNIDLPVLAICTGKLLSKRIATGYGGVVVQECSLNKEAITVVYGHLNLSSIKKEVNDKINIGEEIGILGKGFSTETDRERKHLHLSIYKGKEINIKGYVNKKEELADWLDPCLYICK